MAGIVDPEKAALFQKAFHKSGTGLGNKLTREEQLAYDQAMAKAHLDGDVRSGGTEPSMNMGVRGEADIPTEDPSVGNLWGFMGREKQQAEDKLDEGEMVKSPDIPMPSARPGVKLPQSGDEWAEFFKKHPDYLDKPLK